MPEFNWEDPFGTFEQKKSEPVLWMPGKKVAPANLRAIRAQQKELLPALHGFRKIAVSVLKRAKNNPEQGPLFIKNNERIMGVTILFRAPRYPDIIQRFGPIDVTDNAVALPASHRGISSTLDGLFPIQHIANNIDSKKKPVIDGARVELGLIERIAISPADITPERIIVYPRVLRLTAHWIGHFKPTIAHVISQEAEAEHDFEMSTEFELMGKPAQKPRQGLRLH